MIYPGFIGQSYASSSFQLDAESCKNLYPEVVNLPGVTAKSKIVLRRRPGYTLQQTLGDSPGRGTFTINGRCFAVSGSTFYELTSKTTAVKRGTVAAGSSPVLWAATQTQLAVVSSGIGYIFTFATNSFQQITAAGFPSNCVSITSLDTYFIALGANSNQFSISGLLNGLAWNGVDFGSSQEPDNAVAIAECHLYLWIFGRNETILFQDSGNASFPFTRVPGSQMETGCAAAGSVATLDNTLFWLGADELGAAVVYRANGLLPERISTHAVEQAIQAYGTFSDAVASTYQHNGHVFYSLHCPSANYGAGATWTYDVATQMWHERCWWNVTSGTWAADAGRYVTFAFGAHLALDYSSGNVYQLAGATDAGNPLRWLRCSPFVSAAGKRLFFRWFQLDMQVGGGLPSGADPQVMIRWTNDGGGTWSDYRQASCGKASEFLKRVITRLCGSSRLRAFEVSGTDPVPELVLFEAYVGMEEGLN